jgi:hypothetical protein
VHATAPTDLRDPEEGLGTSEDGTCLFNLTVCKRHMKHFSLSVFAVTAVFTCVDTRQKEKKKKGREPKTA